MLKNRLQNLVLAWRIHAIRMMRGVSRVNIGMWLHQILRGPENLRYIKWICSGNEKLRETRYKCFKSIQCKWKELFEENGQNVALTRAQSHKRARRAADVVTIGLWLE